MMKTKLVMLFISSFVFCSLGLASDLDAYQNQIDYSCNVDADCEVKDVGNCCGYYPQCVNSEAGVDPGLVSSICQDEGIGSICGYQDIDLCECIKGLCVSASAKKEFDYENRHNNNQ